jgi:hypothetical protein
MLNSVVLEVGIGLALTFLLFSLILTSAQEGIESILKGRAKDLEETIKALLDDDKDGAMTKKLYEHPLIYPLFVGDYDKAKTKFGITTKLPSYIPKGHFAAALADIVSGNLNGRSDGSPAPSAQVGQMFRLVNDATQGGAQVALTGIETWYDGAMDRLSGRYKRKTQKFLFVIAFAVAAIANINAIHVADGLAKSQQLRDRMISIAPVVNSNAKAVLDQISKINTSSQVNIDAKKAAEEGAKKVADLVTANGLPIGRNSSPSADCTFIFPDGFLISIAGWLITALAGMLGAPFWFDALAKFMNVRAALKPDTGGTKADAAAGSQVSVAATPFPGATAGLVGGVQPPLDDDLEDCCLAHDDVAPGSSEGTSDDQLPAAIGGIMGWNNSN